VSPLLCVSSPQTSTAITAQTSTAIMLGLLCVSSTLCHLASYVYCNNGRPTLTCCFNLDLPLTCWQNAAVTMWYTVLPGHGSMCHRSRRSWVTCCYCNSHWQSAWASSRLLTCTYRSWKRRWEAYWTLFNVNAGSKCQRPRIFVILYRKNGKHVMTHVGALQANKGTVKPFKGRCYKCTKEGQELWMSPETGQV